VDDVSQVFDFVATVERIELLTFGLQNRSSMAACECSQAFSRSGTCSGRCWRAGRCSASGGQSRDTIFSLGFYGHSDGKLRHRLQDASRARTAPLGICAVTCVVWRSASNVVALAWASQPGKLCVERSQFVTDQVLSQSLSVFGCARPRTSIWSAHLPSVWLTFAGDVNHTVGSNPPRSASKSLILQR